MNILNLFSIVLLTVAVNVSAKCPNFCNGHGRCSGPNKCECFDGWNVVGDCSQRNAGSCPKDHAWVDVSRGVDDAHNLAECSNRGKCDHSKGICDCFEGYGGIACNRMLCPKSCSGHGTCRSMRYHAKRTILGLPQHTYVTPWDAEMIFGCECDVGWEGYDCSLRACPFGDDPLVENELDEIQLLRCDELGDTSTEFFLDFKGELTEKIDGTFTAAQLQASLEKLTTIESVRVNMHTDSSVTTVCALDSSFPTEPSRGIMKITFLKQFDPLPRLAVLDTEGNTVPRDPENTSKEPDISTAASGEGLEFLAADNTRPTVVSQKATKQSLVCSGRGNCNRDSGLCECYTGFGSSNAMGDQGSRGDCGFDIDPITSCPGINVECSGHGTCSGSPEYRCTCNAGWIGGDCKKRSCPMGKAWFDSPTADNEAHSLLECSGKGTCNRDTGKCKCQSSYVGEACEEMTCPGQTSEGECSGHGECISMSHLADFAKDNGVPIEASYGFVPGNPQTWDARKVFGCICDQDWQGFDCSLRTCPFGDDVTTSDQSTETQKLRCTSTDPGSFKFSFRGQETSTIDRGDSAETIKTALEDLNNIGEVVVTFSNGNEACPDSLNNDITVTFLTEHGDLPPLQAVDVGENLSTSYPSSGNPSSFAEEHVKGTTENDECNGRGICNRTTGFCKCFTGFGSSDGKGGAGGRNDCGYREPFFLRKNGNTVGA